jgi:hypothetical protein
MKIALSAAVVVLLTTGGARAQTVQESPVPETVTPPGIIVMPPRLPPRSPETDQTPMGNQELNGLPGHRSQTGIDWVILTTTIWRSACAV